MPRQGLVVATTLGIAAFLSLWVASSARSAPGQEAVVTVAVTTPDVEAIVRQVGGRDIETFSLFRGCLLRRDLLVEDGVLGRLARADVVVWTGFFNESSAIAASIAKLPAAQRESLKRPLWIDVSRGATRINVPTSSCEGYVDLQFMPGDPFFWLNPRNGRAIAANVAEGLAELRPDRREFYSANAAAFARALDVDIARWSEELDRLAGLRVFSAQCGWQNLAQLGGPTFLTCRKSPGVLDPPEALASQIDAQGVQFIIVDPNTPPQYAQVFRVRTKARVLTIPSSIADLPGATTYGALFDNLIRTLKAAAAGEPVHADPNP